LEQDAQVVELEAERDALRRELFAVKSRYDELRHRVNNEFQVFLSSFKIQERNASSPPSCGQCISRMWSVVALHKAIESSPGSVEMTEYLHFIIKAFETAFGGPVQFIWSISPDLYLDAHRASHVGQIFCEAAMNAIKHGFHDGSSGHVVVTLRRVDDKSFELTVANDGAALELKMVPPSGFHALKDLARQMNGELHIEPMQKGVQVRFRFTA
jgi:two-component sensor histidine kinase